MKASMSVLEFRGDTEDPTAIAGAVPAVTVAEWDNGAATPHASNRNQLDAPRKCCLADPMCLSADVDSLRCCSELTPRDFTRATVTSVIARAESVWCCTRAEARE